MVVDGGLHQVDGRCVVVVDGRCVVVVDGGLHQVVILCVVVVDGGLHHVTGCCRGGCGVPALGKAGNVNGVVERVNGGSTVVEYAGSY